MTILCPKCNSPNLRKRGFSYTKKEKKQVHQCLQCKRIFILHSKRIQITQEIRQKVIQLYHTYKPTVNKFDALKKHTLTTRDIARRLGIAHSTVGKIIKLEE